MLPFLAFVACTPGGGTVPTAGQTGDTGGVGTPPTLVFDETRVLVVPHHKGLSLFAHDGTSTAASWSTLVGPCADCGGEGASADGDGLLLAFTTGVGQLGDVARLDGTGALDFRVGVFDFPHGAARDPADGTLIVPESTADRISWIPGDGTSSDPVRQLDADHPQWPGQIPNGIERFDHEGRSWLLASHRGSRSRASPGTDPVPNGLVSMWDITDPQAPTLAWTFPQGGGIDTPHGSIIRERDGRFWLLYAHTEGAEVGGSVGLAVTDDLSIAPEYVADLVPAEPFTFLRGVELTGDGWLYLTDSGGTVAAGRGRIVKAPFPADLSPTGASGVAHEDQVFVDLDGAELFAQGLDRPFQGWLWTPTFSL